MIRRNYGSDGTWLREFYERAQAEVGRRIRQARKALGWTQEHLGDATAMDASQISRFERGTQSMHLRTLLKIANVLAIDPADLVRGLRLPRGDDPVSIALAREYQRYEEEVAVVMTKANERLDSIWADHERRTRNICASFQ